MTIQEVDYPGGINAELKMILGDSWGFHGVLEMGEENIKVVLDADPLIFNNFKLHSFDSEDKGVHLLVELPIE